MFAPQPLLLKRVSLLLERGRWPHARSLPRGTFFFPTPAEKAALTSKLAFLLKVLLPEPVRWQRVEQRGGGGTTCVRPVSTFLALTHGPATLWDDGIFTEEEAGGAGGL